MKIGFSTATLKSILDLPYMIEEKQPEVIEICNCPSEKLAFLEKTMKQHSVEFGLHCPLPFTGWMSHFDITGPDCNRQEEAFELVRKTFETAHCLGASFVLAHFPTVFLNKEHYEQKIISGRHFWQQILQSANRLEQISLQYNIPLFLENVGPNTYFCTSDHFVQIFESFPQLKMCLDLGHHYVLPGTETIKEFTERVAPYVASAHIYNTSLQNYKIGNHTPPYENLSPADGWMNLPELVDILLEKARLKYFIFEYTYTEGQIVSLDTIKWLVDFIKCKM